MKRGFRELPPRHQASGANPAIPYNMPIAPGYIPGNPGPSESAWNAPKYVTTPNADAQIVDVHEQLQRIKAAQACEIINSRVMMALEQQEKQEALIALHKKYKKNHHPKGRHHSWSPNNRAAARRIKQQKRRRTMVPPGFGASIDGPVVSHKNNSPDGGSHVSMGSHDSYTSSPKGYPSPFSRNKPRGGSLSNMRSKSSSCYSFRDKSTDGHHVKASWVPVTKHRLDLPQRDPPQPPASPSSAVSSSSSSSHPDGNTPIPGVGVTSKDLDHKRNKRMAPAHSNIQSVISASGGIYHPCHGYSTREISIFDLFPGIVKYQSKRFGEADRIKFLLSQSQKPFCGVNGRPLGVDESEMWFTALKYLFNDITLGQFEYMTEEMQFLIKQYMSTHKKRRVFLTSIIRYGFLRVVSDLSKKLPRQEIKQQLAWEKRRKKKELNKMVALQQAKQKLMEQQMAHVPVASVHPTVTPLKLLTPDAASNSPRNTLSTPPRHLPPRRKGLSLTYAPPPQFGGPSAVMTPQRIATRNGAVPLQPQRPLTPLAPNALPLSVNGKPAGPTPVGNGNLGAVPFDPLGFTHGTVSSLRSQRAVSAPFSMLPTAPSSNYSRSHTPMTRIGSHAVTPVTPMAPFIAPELTSTVTHTAPYTSVGTLPTVPAATNENVDDHDSWDVDQVMSEIDREMDIPDLPPDQGTSNSKHSMTGIDEEEENENKGKNADLSLFIDAMEFVPSAQRQNENENEDEMKDSSLSHDETTPTTGTDHQMATPSPVVSGNDDQDAEMKMEELNEDEEKEEEKELHKSSQDLYGGRSTSDGDDLNVYALLFDKEPHDVEEKTHSNDSRQSEELEVQHNDQNDSQLVLMNLDDRKVSEEPTTAATTCNTISSGSPATGSSNEELRECTPDKNMTKGLWDAISGVNDHNDNAQRTTWSDDNRDHGQDQDLDEQKEIDLAMVDMNASNDNARAMIDGPDVCFSDLSDVPPSAATKNGAFVATLPFKWSQFPHSRSIWVDNPYVKPTKYFGSKPKPKPSAHSMASWH